MTRGPRSPRGATDFSTTYGPWAIVTGASSGIGEAFAHALAKRGVRSLLVARRAAELERVCDEIHSATGVECDSLVTDLADPGFIDDVMRRCEGRDVGLVVSNAGYNPEGSFDERPLDDWLRILDVNDRAALMLAYACLPVLARRGRGGFLLTGSVEGLLGFPHSAVYSSSKAFIHSLGEALWGEFETRGVDVLVLAPGPTDTPLWRSRKVGRVPGTMSAEAVAEAGLEHLGRGPLAVPGAWNRVSFRIMRSLPRRLVLRALVRVVHAVRERRR